MFIALRREPEVDLPIVNAAWPVPADASDHGAEVDRSIAQ
jgi:hypothetical protein